MTSSVLCTLGNGSSNRVMYSIRLPADSTTYRRTPVNWVIGRFRLVPVSPFCLSYSRLLCGYLFIIPDSLGLDVADSSFPQEIYVSKGDPLDVPWFQSAFDLILRMGLLTTLSIWRLVGVPAVLLPVSLCDPIADCVGLFSNATFASAPDLFFWLVWQVSFSIPVSLNHLSFVNLSATSWTVAFTENELAENLITILNLDNSLAFSTVVETFFRSWVESQCLRVSTSFPLPLPFRGM